MKKLFNIFRPWRYSVIRLVGTERQNCDAMTKLISQPWIKPVSYSCTLVEKRYISTLIIKHKNTLNGK